MSRVPAAVASITCALLLAACGGSSVGPNPPPPPPPPPAAPVVTSVTITPPAPTTFIGDTLPLTATVRDQFGAEMLGKTVAWSSSAITVASVLSTGRVVGIAAGSATVTATVEGKSGISSVTVTDPGPRVTLQTAKAVTQSVGQAGGTLSTTSAEGVRYDFILSEFALESDVSITMTPITSIRKLPFTPGMVGGVEFKPSGLKIGPGARLVITPPAALPALGASQRLIGFTFEGDGESIQVEPAAPVTGGYAIQVEHFSGGGLAIGNVSDLASLPPNPTTSQRQIHSAELASLVLPQDLSAAVNVFKTWAAEIKPRIDQAQTGIDAKIAVDLFLDWEMGLASFSAQYPANAPALTIGLTGDLNTLIASTRSAMQRGIAALNQQCLQLRDLLSAENVLYLRGYTEAFTASLTGAGSGLTLNEVRAALCIKVVQSFSRFPDPFATNASAALEATYGIKFGNDPNVEGRFFAVTLRVTGAANNGTHTVQTDGTGRLIPVAQIATGVTPITIEAWGCPARSQVLPANADLFLLEQFVCHVSTINAGPQVPLVIVDNLQRRSYVTDFYRVFVLPPAGCGVAAAVWSISAGQLPPGINLNSAGRKLEGTPTSQGTFSFALRAECNGLSGELAAQITVSPAPEKCTGATRDGIFLLNQDSVNAVLNVSALDGTLWIATTGNLTLPNLRCLGGGIRVLGASGLTGIDLPALEVVEGRIQIGPNQAGTGNAALQRINLPALRSVASSIEIGSNPALTQVNLPAVRFIESYIAIQGNPKLNQLTVGAAYIYSGLYVFDSDLASLSGLAGGMYLGHAQIMNNLRLCAGVINAFAATVTFENGGKASHNAGC